MPRFGFLSFVLYWISCGLFDAQVLPSSEQESVLPYARKITAALCSPSFDGRGYVNSGCNRAGNYLLEEFKRIGLLPFQGRNTQAFFLEVNTFPSQCAVRSGHKTLQPGVDYLVHPSSGGYKGKLKLIPMNAAEILAYSGGSFNAPREGIVFMPSKGLSRDSLKLVRTKLEKIAETERGVVEITSEKLTWSVSPRAFRFPYLQRYDTSLTTPTKHLFLNIQSEIKAKVVVQNCFGLVPSVEPSDSLILVCAHYDHLGRMGKDTYFPGANDNASGVAMMLSLARELQQNPLQHHSVLFVAFAGEEIGLEGSFAMVQAPWLALRKISMVLNLDILGSGEEGITVVNGSIFPKYYQQLVQINDALKAVPVVKSRGKAANSDHFPFSEKGVPALFVYTMGPNKNYHDIHDTYQNLSFNRFEQLFEVFLEFLKRF